MAKLIGCLLIYSAFFSVGVWIMRRHNEEVAQYRTYLFILNDMINSLKTNPPDLAYLLRGFDRESNQPFADIFLCVAEGIEKAENDLLNAWSSAFKKNSSIILPRNSVMDFYSETARAFLNTKKEVIIDRLCLISKTLTEQIHIMEDRKKNISRMYARLIRLGGLAFIVLIL